MIKRTLELQIREQLKKSIIQISGLINTFGEL